MPGQEVPNEEVKEAPEGKLLAPDFGPPRSLRTPLYPFEYCGARLDIIGLLR